jgi:hypothetical protein
MAMVRPTSLERTGVLVIRVWMEPGGPAALRARVTHILDIVVADEAVIIAASQEEIYAAVQAWLQAFVAS